MKRFISNSIIFILIGVCLFHAKPFYLLYNEKYKSVVAGNEIYYSIQKSKKKNKSKKALFGDSVARQLFDNKTNNDTINSLACNQSIGMVGHYILLNNYLAAGNEVDTVYFIFRPFTFQNNLDQVYTYHYFLKPFYKKEYNQYFTETVKEQVAKIPYNKFCRYPSVLTSNWAPAFKTKDKNDYTFLSPITVEYFKKIKELSVKHSFKVIVLPAPVNSAFKSSIEKFDKKEIEENGFGNEFNNFFQNIIYLDNSYFSDSAHLNEPAVYTEYYKRNFLMLK
jgi:hypothetical protein